MELNNKDLSGNFSKTQQVFLGLQNTLAMSGVILVPILSGLNVSVTLFCAGIGTLLYHLLDKGMIPAFLGGSFAYLVPLSLIVKEMGIPYAQGGILFATAFYIVFAIILQLLGKDNLHKIFPPIVTGPIIMAIGLSLAGVAVNSSSDNWIVAFLTFGIAVVANIWGKGMTKILTIVIALVGGYIIAIFFNLVDFSIVASAPWFGVPKFTLPQFSAKAIFAIAPAAIVPCIEHIGDVIAIGNTVGKDFTEDPGLPRSLASCGVSTFFSGMIGGPPLTIHSENTGVLAITQIYSPFVVRCGAAWMALLAFVPKFSALAMSIPSPVLGGIGLLLYGMIACVGLRTVYEGKVDFSQSRNLVIASAILILSIGGAALAFPGNITIQGLAVGAIAGIILNLILPKKGE